MKSEIKILKAFHGDSILIKSFDQAKNEFNVLIDGGTASTFEYSLKKELKKIDTIHLLVLTHIDSDHISGLIRFFKNSLFKDVKIERYWINGANLIQFSSGENISYNQGRTLEELLIEKNEIEEKWKNIISFDGSIDQKFLPMFKILSPTKSILDKLFNKWPTLSSEFQQDNQSVKISSSVESQIPKGSLEELAKESFKPNKTISNDIFNSSSIAFILELFDCSILLLGDSRPEVIVDSLLNLGYTKEHPLKIDFVKISHHGSKNNTSCELLDLIYCNKFIISTNGGNSNHKHPDREVIARIIFHPKRNINEKKYLFFNYPIEDIQKKCGKLFNQQEFETGNWELIDNINILP